MIIRRERAGDELGIDEVHRQAFAAASEAGSQPAEVALVRALRASPSWVPALSLVADGGDGIVGHVCLTRGLLRGTGADTGALGLGPLGVLPAAQGHGVGSALMHAALGAAEALGETVVVLLGNPAYYRRFGFGPASDAGIVPDVGEWGGPPFQARVLAGEHGSVEHRIFRYAEPFYDLV